MALSVLIFDAVDQAAQFAERDLLLLDQRRDRPEVGILEIAADHAAERRARKLLLAHHRIVLVGAAEGVVGDIAFGFERADHRRKGVEMGFGIGRKGHQFAYEQRTVLPEAAHQLLFPACQFFRILFHISLKQALSGIVFS